MNTYKVKVKGFRMVPVEEEIEVTGETSDSVFRSFDQSGDIQDSKILSVVGNDDEYYPEVENKLESVTVMTEGTFLEHQDPTKIRCQFWSFRDGGMSLCDLPIELSEEDVTWVSAWEPIWVTVSTEVHMSPFSVEDIQDGLDENDYVTDNYLSYEYDKEFMLNDYELLEGYQPRFTEVGKSKIRALLIDQLLSTEKVA
ncbi:hypothetical protein OAW26_02485 [Luminiphilus sp.]|nr:hypothetical protein [Luminiphilus sp.]